MASPERQNTQTPPPSEGQEIVTQFHSSNLSGIKRTPQLKRLGETLVRNKDAQKERKDKEIERLREVLEKRRSEKANEPKPEESNEQFIFQNNQATESNAEVVESNPPKKPKKKKKKK